MADDWDLYAVVRSCFNAAATSTASSSTTTDAATAAVENSSLRLGETSSSFLTSPFQSGGTSSDFPGFVNHTRDSFRGLEEIYKEPYEDTQSFVDFNSQAQHNPTLPSNSAVQAIQSPRCTADQTPQQQLIYGQPQQLMQHSQRHSHLSRETLVGSSLSFPSASPQPIRPRRRKNQQAKRIQRMTQEELSADSWAWRKYGQKPIKDSPYPRNYYRCSTSKGCTARKQVERCPAEPGMYVVSYSGEHSHPRPTHRSSLAGTTRSKVPSAAAARPTTTTNIHNIASSSIASCSSSSPASASSFSPTATPITEGDSGVDENAEQEAADNENNNNYSAGLLLSGEEEGEDHEAEGWADDGDDDEDDGDGNGDDDILIPNCALLNDDHFFKGLHFKD